MRQEKRYRACTSYPCRMEVRATETEKHRIAEIAKGSGVSASRFLVRLAVEGKAPPSLEEREMLHRFWYVLDRAGVNLNQIAHRVNRAALGIDEYPSTEEVQGVVHAIRTLMQKIERGFR